MIRDSDRVEHDSLRGQPFMSWGESCWYVAVDAHSPDNAKEAVKLVQEDAGDFADNFSCEPIFMYYVTVDQAEKAVEQDPSFPEEAMEGGGWVECAKDHPSDLPFYKIEEC